MGARQLSPRHRTHPFECAPLTREKLCKLPFLSAEFVIDAAQRTLMRACSPAAERWPDAYGLGYTTVARYGQRHRRTRRHAALGRGQSPSHELIERADGIRQHVSSFSPMTSAPTLAVGPFYRTCLVGARSSPCYAANWRNVMSPKSFAIGLGVGAVVGALVTLLSTPKTGVDPREF